jgi:hypothetical protein
MATVSQLKIQLGTNARYTGGEAVLPLPPSPPPPPATLIIRAGAQPDGTDYGDVKVEDGKLVLDVEDLHFNPDYGTF